MAVIFFDGFNRTTDTYYWLETGASNTGDYREQITASNPVTNNIKLRNIGTQSNKKIYLGVRLSYVYAADNQPFITFYNTAGSPVLQLTWNTSTVAYPDIGINVGTTGATYTVSSAIASVAYSSGGSRYLFDGGGRVLEFQIDLSNNTIQIHYNGQSLFNAANSTTTGQLALGNDISSLAIFGSNIGTTYIHDVYLVDDNSTFANSWLGVNFAVHAPSVIGAAVHNSGWTGTPSLDGSYLQSSDGDSSYVRTAALDATVAYDLQNISPSGYNPVVGGIRVASTSRRLEIDAAYKYLYRNQTTPANYEMGTRISLGASTYAQQPAQFINVNPETGAQWAVAEINANAFGVKSVSPA